MTREAAMTEPHIGLTTAATRVQDLVEHRYDDLTGVENLTLAKIASLTTRIILVTYRQLADLYTEGQEQVRWQQPRDFRFYPDGRVVPLRSHRSPARRRAPYPMDRGGPMRFTITWREGAYYVDVPEYEGGEVVTADEFDILERAWKVEARAAHDLGIECERLRAALVDARDAA